MRVPSFYYTYLVGQVMLLAGVAGQELAQMLEESAVVTTAFDWEWVLIRVNSVEGSLGDADWFSAADAQVIVTALDAVGPPVTFDKPLSLFESIVETSTNDPEW